MGTNLRCYTERDEKSEAKFDHVMMYFHFHNLRSLQQALTQILGNSIPDPGRLAADYLC